MRAVYMTDQGRIRSHNEDNGGIFVNGDGYRLAIVADGMGGHRAGDVASGLALAELKNFWENSRGIKIPGQAERWLKEHIGLVNGVIFRHARSNEACDGMGTTIVAAIMLEDSATIANIGDSRCYILNESGFRKITEDHSLVNELLRSGQISREDAENHPRKNVLLRALGTEEKVEMDVSTIMFEEGDALLLCSDGLSNKVSEKEMAEVLSSGASLEEKAFRLISLANDYGGEDNITLAIVEFAGVSEGDN
ncbi:Stp1/IreP family PP2C-type Ser/Thr phosphatase [Bacillus sp. FJAT-27245]|uniref:Stp1/IreP family PP2C-type Ser/Thr phosphatase n=1 Tax=Bacillus sp. FJAT-27245 TaxID=1684144 RepID=UPI0006A77252|nr:Stp1/IreP family PP2C-type Ser/Thr phosphatase [Bacillus sp. FJAT-27245]